MKLVLDTNILISAILWHGPSHDILRLIEKGTSTLCITPAILKEIKDVLNRPVFFLRVKERMTSTEEILAKIIYIAELYPDKKIANIVKNDPDDDKILACAMESGAKYVITGDQHLLRLKEWSNISIVNPRQFLNSFK